MVYFAGMTPVEVSFIRVYVSALRRHYDELRTVVDVMNPDNLGIKSFYEATLASQRLKDMGADFEKKLSAVRRKHHMKAISSPPHPSDDDLVELFRLSFFKLITAADNLSSPKNLAQYGWFSGKPEEWQKSVQTYKGLPTDASNELVNLLSQCFNAFAKFFGNYPGATDVNFKQGKHIWPAEQSDDDFNWFFYEEDEDE